MKLIKKLPARKDKNGKWLSYALFWCDFCKQEVERLLSNGRRNKSCGCYKSKARITHGQNYTKLYFVWQSMKQRVLNLNNKSYKDYGGRGITICNEWLEFIPFRDWSLNNGYTEGLQINRINNDGNYEPINCNFVTRKENNRNQRNTITMKIANEIRELWNTGNYTQKELTKKFNLSKSNICNIIRGRVWL